MSDTAQPCLEPVDLVEGDDAQAIDPLPGWDAEAHADEYADDPAVQVTDDTPERGE